MKTLSFQDVRCGHQSLAPLDHLASRNGQITPQSSNGRLAAMTVNFDNIGSRPADDKRLTVDLSPLPERDPIQGRFEVDTGCDGGLCLGSDFVEANNLLEASGETKGAGRRGVGGDTGTRTGRVPKLRLGTLVVEKPLTNFFLEGSPVDAGYAGHIGMDVFRRFKVIYDYARQRIILEKAE